MLRCASKLTNILPFPRTSARGTLSPPPVAAGGPIRAPPAAYRAQPRETLRLPPAQELGTKGASTLPAMSSPSRSLSDQQDVARLIPQVPAPVGAPPLPDRYGIPRLVLMVKDPHSLFAYW